MEEVNKEVTETRNLNFLEEIIEADLASGKCDSIMTRFPPEPNGYLHIGHAKSICINFGLAKKYGGKTNLRFDDTNPVKEDTEYVDSIKEDIKWLGFEWENERYASDYFDQLYDWAEELIKKGLAYVDDQTQEEIRAGRGTVQVPGTESPYRNRSVEENLELFRGMRDGKYAEGEKVLRAKIDMAHPNMLFRDPLLYRVCIVEAEVCLSAVFLGKSEIDADTLRMTDVKVSVRFRREACHDRFVLSACEISLNDLFQKVEISSLVYFLVYLFHICGNNEFANNRANIQIFSG